MVSHAPHVDRSPSTFRLAFPLCPSTATHAVQIAVCFFSSQTSAVFVLSAICLLFCTILPSCMQCEPSLPRELWQLSPSNNSAVRLHIPLQLVSLWTVVELLAVKHFQPLQWRHQPLWCWLLLQFQRRRKVRHCLCSLFPPPQQLLQPYMADRLASGSASCLPSSTLLAVGFHISPISPLLQVLVPVRVHRARRHTHLQMHVHLPL